MNDVNNPSTTPGPIVLFGSGETAPSAQKVFDYVMRRLPAEPQVALLETPAGFEQNSSRVIGRVSEFMRHNLQNYSPQVQVIAARQRGTPFSPDSSEVAAPLLQSNLVFMGPGSPSYAVRQLKDSLTWQYTLARHRLGAALVLASAAVVAASQYALPVYEIFKVGEDLHWKPGLDLFGQYGLPLVLVPHWNNSEGGSELDTSRCFMGQARFARLMAMLPPGLTVLGIDEKTALVIEPYDSAARVMGAGGVTLIHTGHEHEAYLGEAELTGTGLAEVAERHQSHVHTYTNGESFPLSECCPMDVPSDGTGLPQAIWAQALQAHLPVVETVHAPTEEVLILVEQRRQARASRDWTASDVLRQQIAALGWVVKDTKEGQVLEKS